MAKLNDLTDVKDFIRGCTFLGTGGGGDPEEGIQQLKDVLESEKSVEFTPPGEISSETWTVCPFLMGSIAPKTEETRQKMEQLDLTEIAFDSIQAESIRRHEENTGKEIGAVVPIELGGSNTPGAVSAATRLDIPVVDGDYTGRAIPEIPQTTPYLNDLPLLPITSVDKYGNIAEIKESTGYEMAERMGKLLAAASFGLAGQAGFLFQGDDMKEAVYEGTLSKCLEVGRTIRIAREDGDDPVERIVDELDGWLLFEGEVNEKDDEDKEGYYWGTHTIAGEKDCSGREFKIWFKNENHMSWLDDEIYVTSPDSMIVMERETGEPLTNTDIKVGDEIAVIGLRSPEHFRTEKGLNILGPGHFGYEVDYTPIEDVVD